jgi:exportin-2 (importin alpha re-exporter)
VFEGALFQDVVGMSACQAVDFRDEVNTITEFIPYIFQILAQLLELHPATDLPQEYQALLGPLLSANLWEQRGNVPALARIWKALLLRGGPVIAANGQIQGLLGIFQRLIGSKINDIYAYELLQALYEFLPL